MTAADVDDARALAAEVLADACSHDLGDGGADSGGVEH